MKNILILLGPNLNMLGVREPEIYGAETMEDVRCMCEEEGSIHGFTTTLRQSNYEGELVTWIQEARAEYDAIILNAGAYTHTSIAIHDALKIFEKPVIEVHHSDPQTREPFRHVSYIELVATAVFKGEGAQGYIKALKFLAKMPTL